MSRRCRLIFTNISKYSRKKECLIDKNLNDELEKSAEQKISVRLGKNHGVEDYLQAKSLLIHT